MAKVSKIISPAERDIGTQVRFWRTHLRLKQSDLETRAKLAHNAVSRIETGAVSPRIETVEAIAQAMGLAVEELQFRDPPRPTKATYQATEELVARLGSIPDTVREELIATFNSLIDLVERHR